MRRDEDVSFLECPSCGTTVMRAWPIAGLQAELDLRPLTPVQEVALRLLRWPMFSVRTKGGGTIWWVDDWSLVRAIGASLLGDRPTILKMHTCCFKKWGFA